MMHIKRRKDPYAGKRGGASHFTTESRCLTPFPLPGGPDLQQLATERIPGAWCAPAC